MSERIPQLLRPWARALRAARSCIPLQASDTACRYGASAALWQRAVSAWQLFASVILACVRGLFRRPRRSAADIPKRFQGRAYPGSRPRDYLLHVPAAYCGRSAVPLVMVLHGCRQDHFDMQGITRFDELADRHGFIVVYPFVTDYRGLRMRNCWGWWRRKDIRPGSGEVEDLWNIIDAVRLSHRIDPERIHVTGLSSGAAMAVAMMLAHAGKIASGAAVAGVAYGESIWALGRYPRLKAMSATVSAMNEAMGANRRPTPLFIAHSTDDRIVGLRAAEKLRDSWLACFDIDAQTADAISGSDSGTQWVLTTYGRANGCSALAMLVLEGLGHGWYGGAPGDYSYPDAPDISSMIWSFFGRHPLRRAR